MKILVAYDVSTDGPAGRRRLRRVAKVCQNFGQRVQKSVFECDISETIYPRLEADLLAEIDLKEDNLRVYRLLQPYSKTIKQFGEFRAKDFNDTLIV